MRLPSDSSRPHSQVTVHRGTSPFSTKKGSSSSICSESSTSRAQESRSEIIRNHPNVIRQIRFHCWCHAPARMNPAEVVMGERWIAIQTLPIILALSCCTLKMFSGGGSSRVTCSLVQATGSHRPMVSSAPRSGEFAACLGSSSPWFFPTIAGSAATLCGKSRASRCALDACAIRSR